MTTTRRLACLAMLLGACGGDDDDVPGGDAATGDAPLGGGDGGSADGGSADAAPLPDANPSAPVCVITSPADGTATAFDVPVMLTATATDLEDGTLTGAAIVWRSDLQVAPLGSGDTLSTTLPPGTNVVTCTATDSTNTTGTASVTVVSKSPFAQINHPGDGETRPAAAAIPFVGVGRDLEDGSLSGSSLIWTSDLSGMFGEGEMFNVPLTAGMHTITLTVTDSDGNTDSTSIALTITP